MDPFAEHINHLAVGVTRNVFSGLTMVLDVTHHDTGDVRCCIACEGVVFGEIEFDRTRTTLATVLAVQSKLGTDTDAHCVDHQFWAIVWACGDCNSGQIELLIAVKECFQSFGIRSIPGVLVVVGTNQ